MGMSDTFKDGYDASMDESNLGNEMDKYMETAVFLQISNSSAILILSARTVSFFFTTIPAWQLGLSTAIGQVLINLCIFFPPAGLVAKMVPMDVLYVWLYDILWLLALDIVKMTANFLWETFKSPDIDKNPALSQKQRQSRRISQNLMSGYAVAKQAA